MKFIFQGNGFPFFLLILFSFCAKNIVICRWGDEVERTSPFQIYYIHLRVGGRGEKTPSFYLINLTAVRGCSYAEVRTNEQARSDASNACPLHLLCKCGVPARGGVWLKPFSTGVAHFYRTVARVCIKCRMSYAHSVELKMFAR